MTKFRGQEYEIIGIDEATLYTREDWKHIKTLLKTSRAQENSIEENTMATAGAAVVLITHSLAAVNGLVGVVNGDGSVGIATIATDPKRQKTFTSGDFVASIDRATHVEHYAQKLKKAMEAENAAAEKEGRDADFGTIDEIGLLQESYAEAHRVSLKTVVDPATNKERVVVAGVTLLSSDDLPSAYVAPVAEPTPPAVLPTPPTPTASAAAASAPAQGTPPAKNVDTGGPADSSSVPVNDSVASGANTEEKPAQVAGTDPSVQ